MPSHSHKNTSKSIYLRCILLGFLHTSNLRVATISVLTMDTVEVGVTCALLLRGHEKKRQKEVLGTPDREL